MSKMKLAPLASAILARRWTWAIGSLVAPGLALAGPTGGNVVGGSAAISNPNGTTTVVNQTSGAAAINWQSFDVGGNEYVIFNQPNASSAVLNRVIGGGGASEILGHMQSNGRVFIINPQGVLFGQGAQVNVGSLVASTMNITDSDFMQGKYVLKGSGSGDVINQGHITAADGGFVVLAGDKVSNSGVIAAKLGAVALASGNAVTLDLNGNGLIGFSVDEASLASRAGVENVGEIVAQGGTVLMTARTARDLMHAAVNNSGVVNAAGITENGGDIYLTAEGGDVANSGMLNASGTSSHDAGGVLIHSDANVDLASNSVIDVTGKNGGTARIIADKVLTTLAGSLIDGRAINQSLGKGGFTELSGHGHMTLGGSTLLGQGGTLLLDPSSICIGATNNCTGTDPGTTFLSQADIEGSLNYGTDVYIIASDSITVGALSNNAITGSHSGTNLTMGIGYVDGGSFSTGGFGYGGALNPIGGGFVNTSTAGSYGDSGNITFQSYGGTVGGVKILGQFTARGATNKGSVTIGKVDASGVDVSAYGAVAVGAVTAMTGDILIRSDASSITANGDLVAARGGIGLAFSGGTSTIGNLSATGSNGKICINDSDCHANFSGSAALAVKGSATWEAYGDIGIDHAQLLTSTQAAPGTLTIRNSSNNPSGRIFFLSGASANLTGGLDLTSTYGGVHILGSDLTAGTLDIHTDIIDIENATLGGTTGTIDATDTAFTSISNSSFSFSDSLSITTAGDLAVTDTDFNAELTDPENGDSDPDPTTITGHDVSITATDLRITGSRSIKAGELVLTATAGDVQIKDGISAVFNTGTFTATQTTPDTAVLIGNDVADPEDTSTDNTTLTFGSLTINGPWTEILHATLAGDSAGSLTVNAPALVQYASLSGGSATFTDNSPVTDGDGDHTTIEFDNSDLHFAGAFKVETNHDIAFIDSTFNDGVTTPAAGSGATMHGHHVSIYRSTVIADTLSIAGNDVDEDGGSTLNNSTFRYNTGEFGSYTPNRVTLPVGGQDQVTVTPPDGDGQTEAPTQTVQNTLDVNGSHFYGGSGGTGSFSAQHSLDIHGSSTFYGGSINVALTDVAYDGGAAEILETSFDAIDNFTLTSADRFTVDTVGIFADGDVNMTAQQYLDVFNSDIEASNASFTAYGDSDGDGISASFSGNTFDIDNALKITGSKGVEFYPQQSVTAAIVGTDGPPTTDGPGIDGPGTVTFNDTYSANTVTVTAGTFLSTDSVTFSGGTGSFTANGADDTGAGLPGGAALFAARTDFEFDTSLTLSATQGSISLVDGTDLDSIQVKLVAAGDIGAYGSNYDDGYNNVSIEASGLDVYGGSISLGDSYITIGNGTAIHGHDQSLLDAISDADPDFPLPSSQAPNASFIAVGTSAVQLGVLDFTAGGDYLYIKGADLQMDLVNGLITNDHLFFNFVPTNSSQITLADLDFAEVQPGLTVALGSSTYQGALAVDDTPFISNDVNYVFATTGQVISADQAHLHTTGRVLVLNSFTQQPPDDGQHEPAPPDAVQQASDAINVISQQQKQDQNDVTDQDSDAAAHAGDGLIEIQDDDGKKDNGFECT